MLVGKQFGAGVCTCKRVPASCVDFKWLYLFLARKREGRPKQKEMEAPIYYPVQECHRMHLLRTTLPICLDKTFEQFSYAAFCSCFDEKVILRARLNDALSILTLGTRSRKRMASSSKTCTLSSLIF